MLGRIVFHRAGRSPLYRHGSNCLVYHQEFEEPGSPLEAGPGADIAALASAAVMLALREHVAKYKDPKEAERTKEELKIHMSHFEEAMKKIRPLSKQEIDMYKNVSEQFGKPNIAK